MMQGPERGNLTVTAELLHLQRILVNASENRVAQFPTLITNALRESYEMGLLRGATEPSVGRLVAASVVGVVVGFLLGRCVV